MKGIIIIENNRWFDKLKILFFSYFNFSNIIIIN